MLRFTTVSELKTNDKVADEIISQLNLDPLSGINYKAMLRKYLDSYRDELQIVVEDNYIDKCYRDSFANFYATKLRVRYGMSIRLSFIEPGINLPKIGYDHNDQVELIEKYHGFMVIRPLCHGIVGRTAVSPEALNHGSHIKIMEAPIPTSIMGLKTVVNAFPHSSQDLQYSTCAETSIWSVMEYYGNKYSEYSPLLPSKIHKILDNRVFQRHIPSHGLQYTDISYVLMNLGFGCKTYSRDMRNRTTDEDLIFHRIFSSYIESGIPLIAAVIGDNLGHAIVCVGKEKIPRNTIKSVNPIHTSSGGHFLLWNDVKGKYVFNDDNKSTCSICDFDNPTPQYALSRGEISSIIVPLNKKIYLDVSVAIATTFSLLELFKVSGDYTVRTVLCSGRSYKDALMRDPNLSLEHKKMFLETIQFPKFIWISEIATLGSFENGIVEGLILQDATEPSQNSLFSLIYLAIKNINIFYDIDKDTLENKMLPLPINLTSYEGNLIG